MKRPIFFSFFLILGLTLLGCGGSGGGKDASDRCEDFCDEVAKCDFEGFDKGGCKDICDEIDDAEDEVDGGCEDAVEDLFKCGSDQSCDALAAIDFEDITSAIDAISVRIEECLDESDNVEDECADDF